MANRFWVGGTGNWDASTTTHWSASDGGLGGASVPSASDTITLNGNSGGGTITMTATGNCFQFTGGAFTGTLNLNGQTLNCLDTGGSGGTFTISGSGTRTYTLGSGQINCNGWDATTTTNLTFNANTSTIRFAPSASFSTTVLGFLGGGLTYNKLWVDRGTDTGGIEIGQDISNNTFSQIKDTGTAAHNLLFTQTKTQTFTTFIATGSSGHLITISSGNGAGGLGTATHTLSCASGIISCDWLSVQHSIATGGASFYAGANSTNNQGVSTAGSGWIFTAPPSASGTVTHNLSLMGVGT